MKLRIRDNSVRLRLTRPEVDAAAGVGQVEGKTSFAGGQSFSYRFRSSSEVAAPVAKMADNCLTVQVPSDDVRQWAESEQVSITAEQVVEGGDVLRILVEKDFACLAPREGEDETDMFPHPDSGQQSC